jgi:hypothetical protein
MTEYRASFDAAIRFGNGGDLTAHGFRVDVPSPDTDEDAIAALFVASLGLLMTDSVTLTNVEVFAEPHKGTPYLTREASRGHHAAGTEFAIDRLSLLGNTADRGPVHRCAVAHRETRHHPGARLRPPTRVGMKLVVRWT